MSIRWRYVAFSTVPQSVKHVSNSIFTMCCIILLPNVVLTLKYRITITFVFLIHNAVVCIFNVISTLECRETFNVENILNLQFRHLVDSEMSSNIQCWQYGATSTFFQRFDGVLHLIMTRQRWKNVVILMSMSYCKFCIYTHPVNSKFTIWH